MRLSRRIVSMLAMMMVMLAAACTAEEASPSTTSASTTTSTTQPTTSTTSTTTSTTSTTVDVTTEVEAEVEAAYLRSYEVFVECYRTLPDCDPAVAFAEAYTDGTYDRLVAAAESRKADGLVFEEPDNPKHARTEILDVRLGPNPKEAIVSFCTLVGDRPFRVEPDGSRTRVGLGETIRVSWGDAEFVLEGDGQWRIRELTDDVGGTEDIFVDEIDEQLRGGLLCDGNTLGT